MMREFWVNYVSKCTQNTVRITKRNPMSWCWDVHTIWNCRISLVLENRNVLYDKSKLTESFFHCIYRNVIEKSSLAYSEIGGLETVNSLPACKVTLQEINLPSEYRGLYVAYIESKWKLGRSFRAWVCPLLGRWWY